MNFGSFLLFPTFVLAHLSLTDGMGICKWARQFPQLTKHPDDATGNHLSNPIIKSSSVVLVAPDAIRENTANQSLTVNIILNLAENSSDFALHKNILQNARLYTADSQGKQSGNVTATAVLPTNQAKTQGLTVTIEGVVFARVDTISSTCDNIGRNFCVTLINDTDSLITYHHNSQTPCATLSCKGVEILQVNLEGISPHITERTPMYNLTVNATVKSDVRGAGVTGTFLWKFGAFFDIQQDCSGNSFPATRTEYLQVRNTQLVPGESLSLTNNFFTNMNLSDLLCPDGPLYLCVEFDKHPDANPPFTLKFFPDEKTKYASIESICHGVEVSLSTVSHQSALVAREGNPCHNFNLNFFVTFGSTSAAVSGTNLWKVVIYGSRYSNGSDAQEFVTTLPINYQLRNQGAISSKTISFQNQPVKVNLTGLLCESYRYVCVKIYRDQNSSPLFNFKGVPNESATIACEPFICSDEVQECISTSNCYVEPSCGSTSVGVNDGTSNPCYCKPSSGVWCVWFPRDCNQLYKNGFKENGVYSISTTGFPQDSFNVYCHMDRFFSGRGFAYGLTVFQRRLGSSVDFSRNWTEYEDGFGDVKGDFWLGNANICHMTQQRRHILWIYFRSTTGYDYILYDDFKMSCADSNYTLASLGSKRGSQQGVAELSLYVGKQFNTCGRRNDCECGWWCCPNCNNSVKTNFNGDNEEGRTWYGKKLIQTTMSIIPYNY